MCGADDTVENQVSGLSFDLCSSFLHVVKTAVLS